MSLDFDFGLKISRNGKYIKNWINLPPVPEKLSLGWAPLGLIEYILERVYIPGFFVI